MRPAETIPGTYTLQKLPMPDGSVIERIVQQVRLEDGTLTWEVLDDKIRALDAQDSKDPGTGPAPWNPPTTDVLTPSQPMNQTRRDLIAHLGMIIGDPLRILAHKKLDTEKHDHLVRNPSLASTVRRLCTIAGGRWASAAHYIPGPRV